MASEKKFDIVVFGATGFTGQYTVDEVAKAASEENLSFAVAARNMSKLQTVLAESSKRIDRNIEETAIIIADVTSYQSLLEMAQQAKVVLNCVGPYHLYGEQVVKACIEGKAHQLDISGEPQYLEKIQLLYNSKAKENGVYIMGSTGSGSIPQEMGLYYTRKQFGGEVTNIESFFSLHSGPKGYAFHTGTLESMSLVVANMKEATSLRQSLFPDPMPDYPHSLPTRSVVFFSKEVNKWCIPFKDDSATTRTMRDLVATKRLGKPFEYLPYVALDSFLQVVGLMLTLLVVGILSLCSLGRSLLLKFPHIFTLGMFNKTGPTRQQIEGTTFSMTFVAHGYKESIKDRGDSTPDKTLTTKMVGPEPAYGATPVCMVQCAITLLKERDDLFHKEGGVFSPGAIFEGTRLVERLQKHNIQLSTVE